MLILSRYENDEIVIDLRPLGSGLVTIRNLGQRGLQTKLGFTAPDEIRIDRAEIFDQRETERLNQLKESRP